MWKLYDCLLICCWYRWNACALPAGLAKYNTDGVGASDAELAAGAPSPGGGGGGGGLEGSALLSDTTGLVGTSYYIS